MSSSEVSSEESVIIDLRSVANDLLLVVGPVELERLDPKTRAAVIALVHACDVYLGSPLQIVNSLQTRRAVAAFAFSCTAPYAVFQDELSEELDKLVEAQGGLPCVSKPGYPTPDCLGCTWCVEESITVPAEMRTRSFKIKG